MPDLCSLQSFERLCYIEIEYLCTFVIMAVRF